MIRPNRVQSVVQQGCIGFAAWHTLARPGPAKSMNVHHLELFFYVAKYEGITEAVRKMPYGIQQPAVSGQILQLERSLGVKLFHWRPFNLTPAGEELYDFVYPFFSRLDHITSRLRGEESQHLRLAASAVVLANHLPRVLQQMRKDFPALRLTLREVKSTEVEAALQKQEADVAVTILHRKAAPGIKSIKLLELPLILLAPANSDATRFNEFAKSAVGGEIHEPLISLPSHEMIAMLFQEGLTKRKLRWETSLEVSDLSLITEYVGNGFGYAATVDIPGIKLPDTVRKISLPSDFVPLVIGILHTGDLKPVAQRFVDIAGAQSMELGGKFFQPDKKKAKRKT